jgi:hypothetical protein
MVVGGKYEISGTLPELRPGAVEARHLVLKRPVQVHFLERDRAANRALLELLDRLPEQQQRSIIDAGEHEGVPYIVTWPLDRGRTLLEWLRGQEMPAPARPAAPSSHGEFTQRFFGSTRPPAAEPQQPGKPRASTTAGEFTRFFSPQVAAPPPESPPLALGKPSDSLSFTQLFRNEVTKPPQAPQPAPPPPLPELPFVPPSKGTSEFTRVVGSPQSTAQPPATPRPQPPPPAPLAAPLPPALPKPALPKPVLPAAPQLPKLPQVRAPLPSQAPGGAFPVAWLIGALALLFVLALLLVLWVVLRKG